MKGEINSNAIIVGEFNTPLTPMDTSAKQKISKETQASNYAMDQLDQICIYRALHRQNNGFHCFLKFTWSILQDKSHPWT